MSRIEENLLEENLTVTAGPLELEAVLTRPLEGTPGSGAVVFAPHPLYGGNLENNVVRAVASALATAERAVLRWNYRGIGDSGPDPESGLAGQAYWQHAERTDLYGPTIGDAEAVVTFLRQRLESGAPVHLVGYSFGATTAARLAARLPEGFGSLVLVAPPLNRYSFAFLSDVAVPYSLVLARQDHLYGEAEIATQVAAAPPQQIDHLDTDHFFQGCEAEAAAHVRRFLTDS